MHRLTKIATIILLSTLLNGCVIAIGDGAWDSDEDEWQTRQDRNSRYIDRLSLGRSMAAIEADLGTPDFSESFQRDGELFQILFYRTRLVNSNGHTAKNETTPLVFIDNDLVGWGESAIDKATR